MSTVTIEQAFELAVGQHQAGNLSQAEAIYRQILSAIPEHAGALHLLGVLVYQKGEHAQAEALIRKAIERSPGEALFHANLSRILMDSGKKEEAVGAQREALRLAPTVANWYALGIWLQQTEARDEAARCFHEVLKIQPSHVESINALGVLEQLGGRRDAAAALFRQAISVAPAHAEAWGNLGDDHLRRGELEEAAAAYRKSLQSKPGHLGFLRSLADVLYKLRQVDEAVGLYRQLLAVRPGDVDVFNNLGGALRSLERLDEAAEVFRQALARNASHVHSHSNLALVRDLQGEHEEAVSEAREAARLAPADARLQSNLLYLLHFDPRTRPEALLEEHLQWNAQHARGLIPANRPFAQGRDPAKRLRIGYISPNFYNHSVGRFMLPVIEGHLQRNTADIACLSDFRVTTPDWATRKFQQLLDPVRGWYDTHGRSDEEVAGLVHDLQIDILVDLAMHMDGSRLPAFARRPAPVQVTYLAYCSTTGLETMDYRLTDRWLDPDAAVASQIYSEESEFLESYWCYAPGADAGEVNELPAVSSGKITFGCLNNFSKVTDRALSAWGQLMQRVPASRLVLHAAPGSHCDRVRGFMAKWGIRGDRIEFRGRVATADYFRQYHQIDIALDPFPYAGGTTTCDALWMGVPVVTLQPAADALAVGRGGVSILHNAGIPEWIAGSEGDYVAIAQRLATDVAALADIRRTLRARLQNSVLMDQSRFAANLESAYGRMWKAWCAGKGRGS